MARIGASDRKGAARDSSDALDKLTTRKAQALRALGVYQAQGIDATDPRVQAEAAELEEVNRLLTAQNVKREPKPAATPAPAKPQSTKDLAPTTANGWKLLGVK
jgi:ribosomal protein L12E/L44/L45/RPP1/RPP2